MPKELFEIKTFNKGIISSPSESDIPQDAASYSLDVNPNGIDGKLSARKDDTTKYSGASTAVSFQSSGRVTDPANLSREDYILHDKSSGNVDLITDFSGTPSVTENIDTGVTSTESNTIEAYSKNVRIAHSASSSVKWIGYTPTNQFGTAHSGIQTEVAKLSTLAVFNRYKKIINIGSDIFGFTEGGSEIYKHSSTGAFIAKSKLDFQNITAICKGTYDDEAIWVYDKDEGSRGTLYKVDPSGMNIVQVNGLHSTLYPKAYLSQIFDYDSTSGTQIVAESEDTNAYISDMKILYHDSLDRKTLIVSMFGDGDNYTDGVDCKQGYSHGLVYKLANALPTSTGQLAAWTDMTPKNKFTYTNYSNATHIDFNGISRLGIWLSPNMAIADETDVDLAGYNTFTRSDAVSPSIYKNAKLEQGAVHYFPALCPLGGQLSGQAITNHTDSGSATDRGDSFTFYASVFRQTRRMYDVSGSADPDQTYTEFTSDYVNSFTASDDADRNYGGQAYISYARTGLDPKKIHLQPVRYCVFNIYYNATTDSTDDFIEQGVDIIDFDMDSSGSEVSIDFTKRYAMARMQISTWKDPTNGYGEYRLFLSSRQTSSGATGELRYYAHAASSHANKPSTNGASVGGTSYYYDFRWADTWGISSGTSTDYPFGQTYGPQQFAGGKSDSSIYSAFTLLGDMSAATAPSGNIFFAKTTVAGSMNKYVLNQTVTLTSTDLAEVAGSPLGITISQDGAPDMGFTALKKYWYKVSFIYDEFQETVLFGEEVITSTGTNGMTVTVTIDDWANTLSKRVTHLNLYRAEGTGTQPDTLYRLVKFQSIQGTEWSGTTDRSYIFYDHDHTKVTVTYDANSGISQALEVNYLDYSKAVILNSHLFVTNAGNSELSSVSNYIFKSLPFKYDMFDWSKDFVICPEDLNAIISYNGRLYGMSDNNTYRIEPNTLYVEDTFNGVGCISQEAFVVTEFGLFFCDQNNIYMHNGQAPIPIGSAILTSPSGSDGYKEMLNVATFSPKVAFDSKEQNVIFFVKNDRALVYNVVKSRWDLWTGLDAKSCFSSKDGKVYASVGNDIKGYAAGTANKSAFTWISKEISAGHQSQDKKFYRIDCPHEGTAPTVSYGFNGAAPSSTDTADNSTGLASVKLNQKKRSMQVKIVGSNADTFVESIGVVFRGFLKLVGVS